MNGAIKSRFEGKYIPEPNSGCWLWEACTTEKGYGLINVGGKNHRAHRVSYQLHKGPIPDGMLVRHTCDTPECVNPDHLLVGTPADNTRDCVERGRIAKGVVSGSAILSEEQVLLIRRDLRPQREIAKSYGIAQMTVSNIKTRKTWDHL